MVFKGSDICLKCGKPYTCGFWCNTCSVKYVQENLCSWSGNEIIDNFIKENQQKANRSEEFFEWIPYNKFKDITNYSAIWKDAYLYLNNKENHEICRRGELNVALRYLDNFKNPNDDFLNEV